MSNDKMGDPVREQFETVFSEAFPLIFAAAKAGEAKAHGDMSVAWWGWKASREALVIELPQQSGANLDWNQAIRYCHQAIEAADVKVMP
ncbi:hypothetical protein [Pseudomonas syringae]|nr:hypothetical protein [Pseudomonas syringae]PYD15829.1 hypothetical protein DND62_06710 [Pseudomonas syringae pv. pisi]PYD34341.1 hypothetical protein DND58_01665 [Pseudomonas syringae pv. pisi]RML58288.1 hypothetical protein ALQ93_00357 [Pseudomonas syringae pv. pisi]RMM20753.1 hypothetical protein ALQ82_02445 [Pseudomonas syringae pv. pisi]